MRSANAVNVVVAAVAALIMTGAIMLAMPVLHPVLESTLTAISPLISADGQWGVEATEIAVAWAPILLPGITFFGVFFRMSRQGRVM